jgi:hypothetical protein
VLSARRGCVAAAHAALDGGAAAGGQSWLEHGGLSAGRWPAALFVVTCHEGFFSGERKVASVGPAGTALRHLQKFTEADLATFVGLVVTHEVAKMREALFDAAKPPGDSDDTKTKRALFEMDCDPCDGIWLWEYVRGLKDFVVKFYEST